MRPRMRSLALVVLATVAGASMAFAVPRAGRDALAELRSASSTRAHRDRLQSEAERLGLGTVASVEDRIGVPTFVWSARSPRADRVASRDARLPESAARAHLLRLAPLYGLQVADVQGALLRRVHDTKRGGIIASFTQVVAGVEVFRDEVRVLMNRDLEPLAVSGYLPSRSLSPPDVARSFRLDEVAALTAALEDFGAPAPAAAIARLGSAPGGYQSFTLGGGFKPARIKPVLFHLPGALEPGWYLELSNDADLFSYVVSAIDGRVLFRHDLRANDAYTYRVWADGTSEHAPLDGPQGNPPSPHPTGTLNRYQPPFVATALVTLQNGSISTGDPWLPPGATETVGNNVDAYVDRNAPDGLSAGDFRAGVTSPGTFDRAYDPTLSPLSSTSQQMASVTQLFYTNNFFHDWYYDAGFDEASGNAQLSNYGRGGVEGDVVLAEAQDYSATNNASMGTPADGGSPIMQMYLWNHPVGGNLTVTAPAGIAGPYATGPVTVAPSIYNVSGDIVLVDDGSGVTTDGCGPIVNSVTGKIALMDLGGCVAGIKLQNALNAGAIGVIVANTTPGVAPPTFGGGSASTLPAATVSYETGVALKNALTQGTVTATLQRQQQLSRDGTIDNAIVAHEWAHYLSNRLVGNANGLNTMHASAMGEGWADFNAMLLVVKPEDVVAPAGANFTGCYPMGSYSLSRSIVANDAYYFGLRRYPYSIDFNKSPLTFRHIEEGVPLPVGPPVRTGADGIGNAEVHATGEVWCGMLWECYAALLRDSGRLTFDQARFRMRDYLVASLKLTPNAPVMTEARDALLAVAVANDSADFALFCEAFARRGLGTGAVPPDRYSMTNSGVVESFTCGGALALMSIGLVDDIASCDSDGYLDNHETGALRVALRNVGATALSATTITVSTSSLGVSFPDGNSAMIASTTPFTNASAIIPVRVIGASGISAHGFTIQYDDPGLLVPGPRTASFSVVGNVDEAPSSTETVEAIHPTWTATQVPSLGDDVWKRVAFGPNDHRFVGPAPIGPTDQCLVTPPLDVAASGNFGFTFSHAYSFQFEETLNFDGGVLEISDDGGGSWIDIGASAVPTYAPDPIYGERFSPLAGRRAYARESPGYPALQPVTVSLGTAYAGKTVLVRFRVGSDFDGRSSGWELDNLAFSNLTNVPFQTVVPETIDCVPLAADDALPAEWGLALSGRNPVTDQARFRFTLPERSRVRLCVYDVTGRRVATLVSGDFGAGTHAAVWYRSAKDVAAGIYFARLETAGRSLVRRVVLSR